MTVETTKQTCGAPIHSSAPRISAVSRKSTPDEGSERGAREPFQLYVRVLQQNKTLVVELDGCENESALLDKVRKVAKLPQSQSINLSFQGHSVTTAAKLCPNSTILVSTRLPGGAFATIICAGCTDIIVDEADAEMTLGGLIQKFVEENPEKKGQFSKKYFVHSVELELPRDEESQEYTTLMESSLTTLGHVAGEDITVEREVNADDNKQESFEVQFLKLIPFVEKRSACNQIKKQLIPRQKDLMKGFIERSLSRDELEYVLCTLTDD